MTCGCISYNQPKSYQTTPEVPMDFAKHFPDTGRPIICIDACISEVMERLWAAGVRTSGCCCGHNGPPPSVILDDPRNAEKAFEILAQDHRDWHVFFWAGPNIERHRAGKEGE